VGYFDLTCPAKCQHVLVAQKRKENASQMENLLLTLSKFSTSLEDNGFFNKKEKPNKLKYPKKWLHFYNIFRNTIEKCILNCGIKYLTLIFILRIHFYSIST